MVRQQPSRWRGAVLGVSRRAFQRDGPRVARWSDAGLLHRAAAALPEEECRADRSGHAACASRRSTNRSCISSPRAAGRIQPCSPRCASWCCRRSSDMALFVPGSSTTPAFPSTASIRSACRISTAGRPASRTIARSRCRCRWPTITRACRWRIGCIFPRAGRRMRRAARRPAYRRHCIPDQTQDGARSAHMGVRGGPPARRRVDRFGLWDRRILASRRTRARSRLFGCRPRPGRFLEACGGRCGSGSGRGAGTWFPSSVADDHSGAKVRPSSAAHAWHPSLRVRLAARLPPDARMAADQWAKDEKPDEVLALTLDRNVASTVLRRHHHDAVADRARLSA